MTAIPEERVEGLVARQVVLADDLARPFSASHGATVACVPPRVPRSFILPSCHKNGCVDVTLRPFASGLTACSATPRRAKRARCPLSVERGAGLGGMLC